MDTPMLWALVAVERAIENWHVWNDRVAENRHDRDKKNLSQLNAQRKMGSLQTWQ